MIEKICLTQTKQFYLYSEKKIMQSFLEGRVSLPIADQQRFFIARTVDENGSYASTSLPNWMRCIFLGPSDSLTVMDGFVDYVTWNFMHVSRLTSVCVQVFLQIGLQWDTRFRGRTALGWVIGQGLWDDVHIVVDIMLQSEVDWTQQRGCIPQLCTFIVNGFPVWKKIIHCFDPSTLTAAWLFLWRNYDGLIPEWAPAWMDLCEKTYGLAANLLEPIHENDTIIDCIGNSPCAWADKIMNSLARIYETRRDRRLHLLQGLQMAFGEQQYNEIYKLVTEFDVGSQSAYDNPLVWERKVVDPVLVPLAKWSEDDCL